MKLNTAEKEMLSGGGGEAKRLAMEILLTVGRALGAEEFVPVVSVQAMAHFGSLHIAGRDWLEKLASMGGKCCVPTTQDPASIPFPTWEEMGYDPEYAENQLRLRDAIIELGELPAWSCTPYNQGSVPRYRQNVAWAESSAVSYANSVVGARTNRTPAGLAVLAALTGRMPKFGFYLDENRRAEFKVVLETELSDLDYNTLGILLGKTVGNMVPALYGLPASATNDNLKYLGASAASSGSVALYHAAGVTPEAIHTDPFEGRAPKEELLVTRALLDEVEAGLQTKHPGDVDLVVVGCPHYSPMEILKVAELMEGRRLKDGCEFWIFTTFEAESLVRRMGAVSKLEAAGVRMMPGTCLVISPLVGKHETLMTDSGKFASYLPSEHHIELKYGSIERCVEAVTVEG
ncbi:aconitase X catalytic domain-containing protein [Oscillospiraceae bacterium OttesenSCG-928-G22]|nr:aconitase X catalytic domain-containing protein [Oscillospiraceae bacterium OttesenSCG-928-G22]